MIVWKEFSFFLTLFLFNKVYLCDAGYLPFDSDEYIPMEISSENRLLGGSRAGQLIQGSLTLSPGIHGNALDLDGSSIIDLGDARLGCFLTPDECLKGFTIAVWLYDGGEISSRNVYYISSGGQTYGSYGFAFLRNDKTGQFCVKTRTQYYITDFSITTGVWNHVVFSWYPARSSRSSKAYINGEPVGVNTVVNQVSFPGQSAFNNIHLGAPNNVINYLSKAKLDELMFWNEVKDEEFVHHMYEVYTDPEDSCSHCIDPHYFEVKMEQSVTSGVFITMATIHNEVNCAMECLKYHLCLGVNWNKATEHCQLLSVVYSDGVAVADTNSVVLIKQ